MGFFLSLSNSTRLRMRSLNCVPEDMSCGRATAHAAVAWEKKTGCSPIRNRKNQPLKLLFDLA